VAIFLCASAAPPLPDQSTVTPPHSLVFFVGSPPQLSGGAGALGRITVQRGASEHAYSIYQGKDLPHCTPTYRSA
jgi:hypothetical protein